MLKSFGKTLGMPGVRLGAIYSNADYISQISKRIPVWNVNCIASYILKLMSNNHFKNRLQTKFKIILNVVVKNDYRKTHASFLVNSQKEYG